MRSPVKLPIPMSKEPTVEKRACAGKTGGCGAAPILAPLSPSLGPALVSYYRACARPLPWRTDPTPYRVWISEIMLQQTRVEAVRGYYARFLARFPDVYALAAAEEEEVFGLWEGLGYYSRARNLHRAAKEIVSRFGGELPRKLPDLLSLPGIGEYTAGAILSLAYNLPVPAVDGNILRIVARLCDCPLNVTEPPVRAAVTAAVASVIPASDAAQFNSALFELGQTVCLPGTPRCGECPVRDLCRGYANGTAATLPERGRRAERRVEERTVVVVWDGERVLLTKRPGKGLLAGLWEPVNLPGTLTGEEVRSRVCALGLSPLTVTPHPPARHLFTHIEWKMTLWEVRVRALAPSAPYEPVPISSVLTADKTAYAVPSAFAAALALLHTP